jgi:hypothetical protein
MIESDQYEGSFTFYRSLSSRNLSHIVIWISSEDPNNHQVENQTFKRYKTTTDLLQKPDEYDAIGAGTYSRS